MITKQCYFILSHYNNRSYPIFITFNENECITKLIRYKQIEHLRKYWFHKLKNIINSYNVIFDKQYHLQEIISQLSKIESLATEKSIEIAMKIRKKNIDRYYKEIFYNSITSQLNVREKISSGIKDEVLKGIYFTRDYSFGTLPIKTSFWK